MFSLDGLLEVLLGFLFHDRFAGTNIYTAKRRERALQALLEHTNSPCPAPAGYTQGP